MILSGEVTAAVLGASLAPVDAEVQLAACVATRTHLTLDAKGAADRAVGLALFTRLDVLRWSLRDLWPRPRHAHMRLDSRRTGTSLDVAWQEDKGQRRDHLSHGRNDERSGGRCGVGEGRPQKRAHKDGRARHDAVHRGE